MQGYRSKEPNENGKYPFVFASRDAQLDDPIQVNCGQCIGCKLEKSRQWAMRMMHESQLHDENSYITLTYSPEHLPQDWSVDKTHFQKFMKRLRKAYSGRKIRFFHCGEYGDENHRPHYHAILFGLDFADKKPFKRIKDNMYYESEQLNKLWGKGHALISDVTFESAAYCARYVVKKVNGKLREEGHYELLMPDGEIIEQEPEYATMSRRPGIGKEWFDKYKSDLYPHGFTVIRGKKMAPPKFYDELLGREDPALLDEIKHYRQEGFNHEENKPHRLRAKKKVKEAQNQMLKREL
jgi:hypothetical protein